MLRLVEIELHSYCNRQCNWCANRDIDRHSTASLMDDETLDALLVDLKRMNYKGYISFSRYNELFASFYPLQLTKIFNKILKIRNALPECTIVCNTNGDFLTTNNFFTVVQSYIDELTIMNYDNLSEAQCFERLKKLTGTDGSQIKKVNKGLYLEFGNMKVLYVVEWKNWNIADRGQSLKEYSLDEPLTKPCLEPEYFIGVNYDGTISPCCNIRNDISEHQKYILGNIKNISLKEMLESSILDKFKRKALSRHGICSTCSNRGGRYTREEGGIFYD